MSSAKIFIQHANHWPALNGQLACAIFCIPDKLSVRSQSDDRQPAHMLYTLY